MPLIFTSWKYVVIKLARRGEHDTGMFQICKQTWEISYAMARRSCENIYVYTSGLHQLVGPFCLWEPIRLWWQHRIWAFPWPRHLSVVVGKKKGWSSYMEVARGLRSSGGIRENVRKAFNSWINQLLCTHLQQCYWIIKQLIGKYPAVVMTAGTVEWLEDDQE